MLRRRRADAAAGHGERGPARRDAVRRHASAETVRPGAHGAMAPLKPAGNAGRLGGEGDVWGTHAPTSVMPMKPAGSAGRHT